MSWGIDADGEETGSALANAYDVRNIVTHEAGHVCGLADLYSARSSELTIYGYGGPGEVRKDSLEAGNVAGLRKLYGAQVPARAPATFFPSLARGLQMQTESISSLFRGRRP